MDEASSAGYWCHACSRMVSPVVAVEIECPRCHTGFLEEMGGAAAAAAAAADDHDDDDLVSDRALSLLGPILVGMLANPSFGGADPENPSGEGDRVILIAPFYRAILREDRGTGISIGDHFLGQGLDLLLQQLGEGDPSKYGTPPARKEAVEAMPRVRVEEAATCAVCLEELAVGEEAREMPCAHRFHGACIVPWLGLHGSCPVCRYQMPVVEEAAKEPPNGGGGEGGNGGGGRSLPVPVPWPLSMLFSLSPAPEATQSNGSSASSGSNS